MSRIVTYMPTYSPDDGVSSEARRPVKRLKVPEIVGRLKKQFAYRPWAYLDAIDSILNVGGDNQLVVVDGKSTESIREVLKSHNTECYRQYELKLYPQKLSQWRIFNDVFNQYCKEDTEYFVYTSSDIIWVDNWVEKAIEEFEKFPQVQILFPTLSSACTNDTPWQMAPGAVDEDSFEKELCNAYVMIFRMDFLKKYGGYPNVFRNCFTESFLYDMCREMGGEMRVFPRGWCYHHGAMDKWKMKTDQGITYYNFSNDKPRFDKIQYAIEKHKKVGTFSSDVLKELLYE